MVETSRVDKLFTRAPIKCLKGNFLRIEVPAESALDEMLKMIKRRALEIAALPTERREGRYEMIHDATRRASISNGQGEDEAGQTASSITNFVRAIVSIMDAGARR